MQAYQLFWWCRYRSENPTLGGSQPKRRFLLTLVFSVVAISTFFVFPSASVAQAQELITPIPSNQLRDATPTQLQAIERIRQRPTTQSLDLVHVDLTALRGDSVRLSIPNVAPLMLSKRNEDIRSPSDFTWYGTLSGVPGQATLVVHDGNITGSIQDRGTLYRIEPIGNAVHALIKVDQGRFPPDHPPSFEQKERRGDIQRPPTTRDTGKSDAPVGIDVMVPYTTAARNAVADINATIQLAVAEANQSYVNSHVNIKLTLVDSFEVNYSETGKTFDTILADFVANATVQSRRNTSGADMAAMIINQSAYCGLADAIKANASTAFAIVHYDCATGYYSFAHEFGHLQGARHDPANDPTTTPFPYGHGFQHLSPPPAWRTIMAYNCSGGCPRLQYWSNPDVQYNGIPMGTAATSNNARVLNETATTVAAFNTRPVGVQLTGIVHLQDLGDQPLVDNQWAGTKGQSRRLEGFSVNFVTPPSGVTIEYMCHLQDRGDLPWMGGGTFCGTRGESRRLEGFAIRLTGANAGKYDVFYSCHVQDIGDTGPYKNGAFCGTRGQSKRVEALEIWVTEKSNVGLQGLVHLQDIGDQTFTQDTFAGTRGQSKRLEGFSVALSPAALDLGVEYMCHLQDLGDTPWKANGDFCGTRGESRRLEGFAIRLTGPAAANSDIYYLCHLQDIGDTGPVKNSDFCGTRGQSRRLEGLYMWAVRR